MSEIEFNAEEIGEGRSRALAEAGQDLSRIREEIGKAMVGQEEVVDQVIIALVAAGHVLIEGVPGLGKTLLVRALAKTFGGKTGRIQFTPDLMPSDVVGHVMYDLSSGKFTIRRGPIFVNLLLADEINRAPAKTQAALLEAMQEQQVTLEGRAMQLDPPFMTLATQNPIEQEGTYPLPEAELDRFLLKVKIDFPSHEEENEMVAKVVNESVGNSFQLDAVQSVISLERVGEIQRLCGTLQVDPKVIDYAVRIVRATRERQGIVSGAGPRGGIALIRAARAHALLNGMDFVTPDNVKAIAHPALRHRLAMSPEMEIEGANSDDALRSILEQVEAPRV